MPFLLQHITLAHRMELGCLCLLSAGQYGVVTELAEQYGVSRQFLYDLRDKSGLALASALAPGTPGRPTVSQDLHIGGALIARTVVVLNQVAHASVRSIQECMDEILGVPRSIGAIHAVLAEAAQRARALPLVPAGVVVRAEADEIFAAGRPVLEVVDRRSAAVLALEASSSRDATAWGCTFLDLAARQVTVSSLTADGAKGLRAGARAAGQAEPHLDHWHTLRDLGRIQHILESEAYGRLLEAERSQGEAAAEAYRIEHGHRPRRGRPVKVMCDPSSVQKAAQECEQAIQRADGATVVLRAVRDTLGPLDPQTGRVRRPEQTRADLEAAVTLLRELGGRAIEAAAFLELRVAGLTAYLVQLDGALTEPRGRKGEEVISFLAWAWQHQEVLRLRDAAEAWPQEPEVARQVWMALDSAGRATGMAENLNSILAPHRATHRGLPANVLAVFQIYRNHRVFPRGKRAGFSPLELMGLASPNWLDVLGYGRPAPTAIPEFPTPSVQTVNTLAA